MTEKKKVGVEPDATLLVEKKPRMSNRDKIFRKMWSSSVAPEPKMIENPLNLWKIEIN